MPTPPQDRRLPSIAAVGPRAWPLLPVLAAFAVVTAHFFDAYPNGWDQTEYALGVRDRWLPHSPHLLFFFAGRALHTLFAAPMALSLLSFGGALLALVVLNRALVPAALLGAETEEVAATALVATALFGLMYLVVREAATQEVYGLLTFLLFSSAAAAFRARRAWERGAAPRAWLAGGVYGLALATHASSLMVLPALAVALLWPRPPPFAARAQARWRFVAEWLAAAGATCATFYALAFALKPKDPARGLLEQFVAFARGIAPPPSFGALLHGGFVWTSASGLVHRLISPDFPASRGAVEASPVGVSGVLLALYVAGALLAIRRALPVGVFCVAYPAPFALYELSLGKSLDMGAYVPFLLPPICVLAAFAMVTAARLAGERLRLSLPVQRAALGIGCLAALTPSLRLFAAHWGEPRQDEIEHYGAYALTAMWASERLPSSAVLLQPSTQWNGVLLGFYGHRRFGMTSRSGLVVLKPDLGPYATLGPTAVTVTTCAGLGQMLDAGTPIYGTTPERLRRVVMEPCPLAWRLEARSTAEAAGVLAQVPPRLRASVRDVELTLYRLTREGDAAP